MKKSDLKIRKALLLNKNLSKKDKQFCIKILEYDGCNEKKSFKNRVYNAYIDFIGSWYFIVLFFCFSIIWVLLNTFILPMNRTFDHFSYMLLNLVYGCIVILQSSINIILQYKHNMRESMKMQNDYKIDLKTSIIIQDLYDKVIDIYDKLDEMDM